MDRRSFLTLIASAPLAALAPLPKVLEQPRLMFHRNTFAMVMKPIVRRATNAYWRQSCECKGSGVRCGDFTIGAGVVSRPRKPPYCTSCGMDWIAEYV